MKKWGPRDILVILLLALFCAGCSKEDMSKEQSQEDTAAEKVTWEAELETSVKEDDSEAANTDVMSALAWLNETYTITDGYGIFDHVAALLDCDGLDTWIFLNVDTGKIENILELESMPYRKVYAFENYMVIQNGETAYLVNRQGMLDETVNMAQETGIAENINRYLFCIDPEQEAIYYSVAEKDGTQCVLYRYDRKTRETELLLRLESVTENTDWCNGFYQLVPGYDGNRVYFEGMYFKKGENTSYPCYGYVSADSGDAVVYQEEQTCYLTCRYGCIFYEGASGFGEEAQGIITILKDGEDMPGTWQLESREESEKIAAGTEHAAFYSIVREDSGEMTTIRRYHADTGEMEQTFVLPHYVQSAEFFENIILYQYSEYDQETGRWLWRTECLDQKALEENPFDLDNIEETGQEIMAAYGCGLMETDSVDRDSRIINYEGGELKLTIGYNNQGPDCQVGLMVFIDGVAQKFGLEPGGEQVYLMPYDLIGTGKQYLEIYLTPEFGVEGEEHYLTYTSMLQPGFVPNQAEKGYGNSHRILTGLPYLISYPVQNIDNKTAMCEDVETWEEEKNGIRAAFYQNGAETSYLQWENEKADFQIVFTCNGYSEAVYRASLWINGEPVPAFDGKYYTDVRIGEELKTTVEAELLGKMAEWKELNALDVILVPLTDLDTIYCPLAENLGPITVTEP